MATFSDNKKRGCFERPDYTGGTPEKPGLSHDAPGDTPDGTKVHGSYKQAHVEKNPIMPDPTSDVDHRAGTKDVG